MECLRDCNAACCRNVCLQDLTMKMAALMMAAGGRLFPVPISPGYIDWLLIGDCPYLDENRCIWHDDAYIYRPNDCHALVPGSDICLRIRERKNMGYGTSYEPETPFAITVKTDYLDEGRARQAQTIYVINGELNVKLKTEYKKLNYTLHEGNSCYVFQDAWYRMWGTFSAIVVDYPIHRSYK